MNKKIFLVLIVLFIGLSLPIAHGKSGSYYSGEVINYNNTIVIGSINSGDLELFKFGGGKITKTATLKVDGNILLGDYTDLLFNIEGADLFVYVVDKKYLYKYKISDLVNFNLEKKVKDGLWGVFFALDKVDDGVATIGAKDVKIWNYDLGLRDSVILINEHYNNIGFNPVGDIVYNINNDTKSVELINLNAKKIFSEIDVVINENHDRRLFFNDIDEELFVADDESLKVFDYNDTLLREFKHLGKFGYDVAGLTSGTVIYFSDGIGVVKLDKRSLVPLRWVFTTDVGTSNGWSMGLRTVANNTGEKVVVFNHSSILVYDDKLHLEDFYSIDETANKDELAAIESLELSLNKTSGVPGETIELSGKGYGLNEEVVISIGNQEIIVNTNEMGRFREDIKVPSMNPGVIRIGAEGSYTKYYTRLEFIIK